MNRAYSLLELLVAIAVIAVGLLAVYASLTYSLNASGHSQRLSEAIARNREMVDLIRSQNLTRSTPGLDDSPTGRRPMNDPPFAALPNPGQMTRNVQIDPVSTDASLPESRLRRIRVTIYWQEGQERSFTLEAYQRVP